MHAGQFSTLREVLEHYNNVLPPRRVATVRFIPLGLSEVELGQLEAFLNTLSSDATASRQTP